MSNNNGIKIGGKSVKRSGKSKAKSGKTRQPKSPKLSPNDRELHDKVAELQSYLSERNIPHYIVCQLPDSKQPVATASFSTSDDPQQAMINAEWLFTHVGGFIGHITNGFLRLIKFY